MAMVSGLRFDGLWSKQSNKSKQSRVRAEVFRGVVAVAAAGLEGIAPMKIKYLIFNFL
jgi:hypothetical protein